MLDSAVISRLVVWDIMCGGICQLQVQGFDVSLTQAAGVHDINCMILGKSYGGSAVAARAIGDFSGTSCSSDEGPEKAAVVARDHA